METSKKSLKRKLESDSQSSISTTTLINPRTEKIIEIRKLMRERDHARLSKDFFKSDTLRDKLSEMGVFVQGN
jgi:cysteinyl-tRNA synthetase